MAFNAPELTEGCEIFDNLEQHFPIHNKEFRESTVDMAVLRDGIAKSEGNAE
ncbi:hypothetical protein [Limosilactobacillus agrestis]|uniref:hypothetical protein n=1 Tax=Limosilactobacillus agrestis TaxID=2759748 RepID=UPI001E48C73B|nr:hypothetical protein [Limosilactobacillus agrestis]MCD7113049.1 hypothetical protein [Limosilactobacillus agrestis]